MGVFRGGFQYIVDYWSNFLCRRGGVLSLFNALVVRVNPYKFTIARFGLKKQTLFYSVVQSIIGAPYNVGSRNLFLLLCFNTRAQMPNFAILASPVKFKTF